MSQFLAFWQFVANFLYSNLFVGLATFVVGLVALFVYQKQKSDQKKDAANIILLEIKNAETKLTQARETSMRDSVLPETVFAMRTSSWERYSYLFVRDFTDKEWELINAFYEKCRLYDEAVEYNNTFFKKNEEQIRVNLHAALATFTKEYVMAMEALGDIEDEDQRDIEAQKILDQFNSNSSRFADKFMEEIMAPTSNYLYQPKKALTDGQLVLSTIRLDLSTSTVGSKLGYIISSNVRSRLASNILGSKSSQR
jgi:hypothetical protein